MSDHAGVLRCWHCDIDLWCCNADSTRSGYGSRRSERARCSAAAPRLTTAAQAVEKGRASRTFQKRGGVVRLRSGVGTPPVVCLLLLAAAPLVTALCHGVSSLSVRMRHVWMFRAVASLGSSSKSRLNSRPAAPRTRQRPTSPEANAQRAPPDPRACIPRRAFLDRRQRLQYRFHRVRFLEAGLPSELTGTGTRRPISGGGRRQEIAHVRACLAGRTSSGSRWR
jgi:hypothetical protein